MSKKTGLIILLSSIFVMMVLFFSPDMGKRLSDCAITQSEAADIMGNRTVDASLLPDVSFGSEKLVLDRTTSKYYYSLISGEVNADNPWVKVDFGSKSLKIAVIVPDDSKGQDIITDKTIREADEKDLLFYDDRNYAIGKLVCTTLPIMSISCEEILNEEDEDKEVHASMELMDNRTDASKRFLVSDAMIELRGGTTLYYPKKPYKLSLTTKSLGNHKRKNSMSLLGMRKEDDWVLYAAYNDQEKIRNVFSQNLWAYSCATDNSFGIDTGLEYKYLELFMNGEYQGLYALGYTPDEKNLGLSSNTLEGYYKKYGANLDQFIPKNKEAEKNQVKNEELTELIYNYYFDLQDHCYDVDFLKRAIDIDNAIDFYLYICLIQGRDNLHKNYYVILKSTEDGYKSVYIPWDMDMSWGNVWIDSDYNNSTAMYRDFPYENYLFSDGYMYWLLFNGDNEAYDMLIKKYEDLRKGAWSDEKVMDLLDEYEEDIFFSGAYLRDREKWPEGNNLEEVTKDNSLAKFKAFVTERFAQMDAYIERLKIKRNEDPFVTQTLCFGDYDSSDLIVRFNSRKALKDEAYSELFKKSGIDVDAVTIDSGFLLYRGSDGAWQEISDDGATDAESDLHSGVDTLLGRLCIGQTDETIYWHDDEYSVFINDLECMEVLRTSLPLHISVISKDDHAKALLLDKRYRVKLDKENIEDEQRRLNLLQYEEGSVELIFRDCSEADLAFLDKYDLDLGGYVGLKDAIDSEDKLVILLNGDMRKACIINDAMVPGTVVETEMGTYGYFEEEGHFGMYINEEEVLTGEVGEEFDGPEPMVIFVDGMY